MDVENLAADAVEDVARAVAELSAARGRPVDVSTSPELIAGSFAAVDHLRVAGRTPAGWAPFSGFVQADDGWVRLHGNYPHHSDAVTSALGVLDRAQLEEVVRTMPADDVAAAITAAGGLAVVVLSEQQWRAHEHGRATAADAWTEVDVGAPRPLVATGSEPLTGIRVLDLTRVIAGPSCTQALACLGADVLRIDPPARPELLEQFLSNGMGKRSIEVDLTTDLDVVRSELLPQADVVVLGYRPGALARFGLDPATLQHDRPDLVIGSLSAWGEHGPWGTRAGFDSIVQAATGIADLYADGAGRPGALPVQALDHATGYRLAAALLDLLRAGHGGVVRASLLGAARTLLEQPRSTAPAGAAPLPAPPTHMVPSPYGPLTVTPLPFTVNHEHVVKAVAGYGEAAPRFDSALDPHDL
ncbi:CoA transferase [Nocardioides sp. cx-173]|uniref:CoA transferase n=1 Tax=Nocardioides sp. cx-173 TaxID=2898796 RepID=UPI001E4A1FC1|nr:CoA transferase [Nocardioides sp. cx-173]MCD4526784.1 CoA transferase [Nocardioides sp. cx-173]UGB43890.1 CoA transferase [Nocardioides sp. cx-173]